MPRLPSPTWGRSPVAPRCAGAGGGRSTQAPSRGVQHLHRTPGTAPASPHPEPKEVPGRAVRATRNRGVSSSGTEALPARTAAGVGGDGQTGGPAVAQVGPSARGGGQKTRCTDNGTRAVGRVPRGRAPRPALHGARWGSRRSGTARPSL